MEYINETSNYACMHACMYVYMYCIYVYIYVHFIYIVGELFVGRLEVYGTFNSTIKKGETKAGLARGFIAIDIW